MPFWIYRIAIASESEVFKRMEAGKGIAIPHTGTRQPITAHQIGLFEHYTGYLRADGADIKDLDIAKTCHMGDKTIYPRTNIHMPFRLCIKYPTRHQKVLPKIFISCCASFFITVM